MVLRPNVAESLATRFRAAILHGELQPGAALPSERELAETYDLNRSSVREAMKRLEAWGLVKIRHGGPTRVADSLLEAGLGLVPMLVEAGGEPGEQVLREVHEIRALILGWGAEQAARRGDPAVLGRLEALAASLADVSAAPAQLQVWDYDFFQELLAASGNRILILIGRVVREVYLRDGERFLSIYRRPTFDSAFHQRAVAAILANDPEIAGAAMRAHAASALSLLQPPSRS